jgi:glycosyltransferase involved in cell wall biosynthesis
LLFSKKYATICTQSTSRQSRYFEVFFIVDNKKTTMLILSNGFPSNIPDSEKVSQGGPANFARLFVNYILANTKHEWIGIMLESVDHSRTSLEDVFQADRRQYFKILTPKKCLAALRYANDKNLKPDVIFKEQISLLAKFVEEKKPSVIFLNGFGILNWLLLKAAQQTNTPAVIQHAGIWSKELSIHKELYSKHSRKLMEQMEVDSSLLTSCEIFLNEWSKNYYQKNVFRGSSGKSTIIPLPFDFASFRLLSNSRRLRRFKFPKENFQIGTIARWDEIKNHTAILALAKSAKKLGLPWTFHTIVDIPQAKNYEKKEADYKKYIDVIPPVDRIGVSDFCRSLDLIIMPSLFDVSPTVVLEAIASGTPVVISKNVGYYSDFFHFEGKKWIVDFSKPEKAIHAIKQLLGKNMSGKLTRKIKTSHNHRKVFAEYLKVFERVAKNKPTLVKSNVRVKQHVLAWA